jgi:YHS domain-containing protein
MSKAFDVVCGMEVDTSSHAKSEYEGKTYYFCCDGCKGAFDKSPDYHIENWQEEHPGMEPTPA